MHSQHHRTTFQAQSQMSGCRDRPTRVPATSLSATLGQTTSQLRSPGLSHLRRHAGMQATRCRQLQILQQWKTRTKATSWSSRSTAGMTSSPLQVKPVRRTSAQQHLLELEVHEHSCCKSWRPRECTTQAAPLLCDLLCTWLYSAAQLLTLYCMSAHAAQQLVLCPVDDHSVSHAPCMQAFQSLSALPASVTTMRWTLSGRTLAQLLPPAVSSAIPRALQVRPLKEDSEQARCMMPLCCHIRIRPSRCLQCSFGLQLLLQPEQQAAHHAP